MKKLMFTVLLLCILSGGVHGQDYYGYLYCHMSRDGEWTAYALSKDGVHYRDLFEGAPIMDPEEHAPVEGGQRDAFVYRRHDDTGYLMVTTDMHFSKSRHWYNHGIDLHRSEDLIHWETIGFDFNKGPEIFSDPEAEDVVDWKTVNRVWAPQIIWNPDKKAYMIYYSMMTSEAGDYDRMYYSYADESFTKITKPRLLFDWGYATIDADINYVPADGLYHMMIKKHNAGENQIYRTESRSLTGPWPEPQMDDYISFEDHRACEGASAFQIIGDPTWRVAYTEYTSRPRKYRVCKADEHLSHFRDPEDIQGVSAPEHGSFMLLTKEEYERLEAWGRSGIPERHVTESDFRTGRHPRIFVTEEDRSAILAKISQVQWAADIVAELKGQIDPLVDIHQKDPSYIVSRMPMNWEPGKRYIRFYTEGNILPRREGNAKYPTIRVKYTRAASNSVPVAPLDKLIPYSDGTMTKVKGSRLGIVKIDDNPFTSLYDLGTETEYESVPFEQTGIGADALTRTFIHTAWKSSILYYLTQDKRYAKLAADIIWTIVRGAAQHEWVNPGSPGASGYLSFETLDDTRHYSTLPLAYDMIYDYLHEEYFDSEQFLKGIKGELWAPPHPEGKQWALDQFEIMFKNMIENKLQRGGGLIGNWNTNEHQSAMLYALALDEDDTYADGKGRAYYVDRLVYGPTTRTHGAYLDVLRANISPNTGLWPEAPGGYGQGAISQLVRFGFIYYRNGLDYLSRDPLLKKASGAMPQMIFPNGYVTNYGDASYATINTDQIELMMAYAQDKQDQKMLREEASLMKYAPQRNYGGEFMYPLFFYLPEIPQVESTPMLERASCSEDYSLVLERNPAHDPKDALAFTLMGFGRKTGHRQPNGMNLELYGRGHVLAPDQGVGQDYWSRETTLYKINVAGHNTVSPNGKGADNGMPQNLEWVHAEPYFRDGVAPESSVSPNHQYVEAHNHFYTKEIKAEQRRTVGIVRTSPQSGYYVDIFRSSVVEGENKYHDYIYHNMGLGAEVTDMSGRKPQWVPQPLDSLSGMGYGYFRTLGTASVDNGIITDFHMGVADADMNVFIPAGKGRTFYLLESPFCHRYYIDALKDKQVPAFLVRQEGEAWEQPFMTIFEPHGQDCPSRIRSVTVEKTRKEAGVAKLTVWLKEKGRKDLIMSSVNPDETTHYAGVEFQGVYGVVSLSGKHILTAYLGEIRHFKAAGIEVIASSPCNVCIECSGDGIVVHADGPVLVNGKQY